jgi:DNA mismatch repair protein MutS2
MAAGFAESALAAIEFPAALDQVSQYAVTPYGAERVRALRPGTDRLVIESELSRIAAMMERLGAGDDVEPVAFPDCHTALERIRIEGSTLEAAELLAMLRLLSAAKVVGAKLRRAAKAAPILGNLAAPPLPDELGASLDKALDENGDVRDSASRELARLRRELIDVRAQLVATLERMLAGLDARQRSGEGVTLRNGRYVIPLRRDGRSKIGGIVHDESATHATLFVEPPETIELGNRLRSVEAEESREVQRILRELTALLRPHADGLEASWEMLVVTDALYARARCARVQQSVPPTLADAGAGSLVLAAAAHPLLFGKDRDIVRFDLRFEPGEKTLLISGPNTGGKTVLLKAIGLAAALTQSGVMPAAGEGSVLPVFDTLIADIGDRQSISESLSTFSAHVATLREVIDDAGPASLVLLDELGTGTDPAEGAALAGAILRSLTARGVTTIATTHLGALKELAGQGHGIVNASLAFDAATLAPTYRFTKGVPGRSYGLAIARRLGMSAAVLAEAEASLPQDERRLDATLAAAEARAQSLDAKEEALRSRETELDMHRARFEIEGRSMMEREEAVARREREIERAIKGAKREALLDARTDVEKAIGEARAGKEKEARRALEEKIAELAKDKGEAGETGEAGESGRAADAGDETPLRNLAPGSQVRIRSLGIEGEVESIQGNDVAVKVRGRRVRVRANDLAAIGDRA